MSHKATTWLADLPPDGIGNSEFRILFHLCDCHNPAQGCFPTQSYLLAVTGVSNGTLNAALRSLEERGLIQRHRSHDGKTHRRRPTRYILGFELRKSHEPTPETGDGNVPKPSPKSGDGAISNLGPKPSPVLGQSHLQPTGDKPVIEPVRNQRARENLELFATDLRAGKYVPPSAISPSKAREMLAADLVTPEALRKAGIAF